jgi:5-methylcytosine-specific restriction endonuclease McrA
MYRRDWNEPAYAKWRKDIRKRDRHKCQWPGCGSKRRLEVHHIKKWSDNPALRYSINNGITLCKNCHQRIKGSEENYELFLLKLLEWSARNDKG